MDWKIELIPVPVTDIDRAKRFYEEKLGWVLQESSARSWDCRGGPHSDG
jgi:predicted enzyme related to lactoylglutathione lyase